jgi:hypothetical protein
MAGWWVIRGWVTTTTTHTHTHTHTTTTTTIHDARLTDSLKKKKKKKKKSESLDRPTDTHGDTTKEGTWRTNETSRRWLLRNPGLIQTLENLRHSELYLGSYYYKNDAAPSD